MGFQRRPERLNGVLLLDALGEDIPREGATYLKARWPYRFVLESLGPGTSRRDLDADLRRVVFLEKIREVEGGVIMN